MLSVAAKALQQCTEGRAFKIAARPSYDTAKSDSGSRRQYKENPISTHRFSGRTQPLRE